MYLIPVRAFADNYPWLLHDGKSALIVDPGDAHAVLRTLAQHGLHLESILVTRYHADYTDGAYAGWERQVSENPVPERVLYRLPQWRKRLRNLRSGWTESVGAAGFAQ